MLCNVKTFIRPTFMLQKLCVSLRKWKGTAIVETGLYIEQSKVKEEEDKRQSRERRMRSMRRRIKGEKKEKKGARRRGG